MPARFRAHDAAFVAITAGRPAYPKTADPASGDLRRGRTERQDCPSALSAFDGATLEAKRKRLGRKVRDCPIEAPSTRLRKDESTGRTEEKGRTELTGFVLAFALSLLMLPLLSRDFEALRQ